MFSLENCGTQFLTSSRLIESIKDYRIPEELDKINHESFLYSAERDQSTKKSLAAEITGISAAG